MAQPQPLAKLRRQGGVPLELLALLVDGRIVLKADSNARSAEDDLVLWDFHDLLFHARSTEGRHANPLGGQYPYAGVIAPPPAVLMWTSRMARSIKPPSRARDVNRPRVKAPILASDRFCPTVIVCTSPSRCRSSGTV